MLSVRPFEPSIVSDLDSLFACEGSTDGCWCMWFIIRVADYHQQGRAGNCAAFLELAIAEEHPMGLIAYDGDDPVGWCAVGPRRRYDRILRAPTLKGRDKDEDNTVWLVPCFFVRPDVRRDGVARALLKGAVGLARSSGAPAIEGIPYAGARSRSGGADWMTGVEPLFSSCGFEPVRRPSNNRVIMRLEL